MGDGRNDKPIRLTGGDDGRGDGRGDDGRGLDSLYRRYAGWLGGMLRKQLGAHADAAEDLVHEAYIRLARYHEADAARHPRALLKQIGVNLARDHMRRNVVRGGLSKNETSSEFGAIADRIADGPDQEYRVQLQQIVLALPPIFRDVFVLSRFSGLSYHEIARHLGISVKTVEWRMSKALALCAERMRD